MKSRFFIIALALIFAFSAVPCMAKSDKAKGPKPEKASMAKSDKAKGPKPEKAKPGDVFQYAFGTAAMDADFIDLCWDKADPQPDFTEYPAEKYSVCLFGPLSFSYGDSAVDEVIDEIELDYSTIDRCLSIDLDMVRGEILGMIEYEYGTAPVIDFTFGTVSAKVKGLDPHNPEGKKRQDNLFSEPYDFDMVVEWPVIEPPRP